MTDTTYNWQGFFQDSGMVLELSNLDSLEEPVVYLTHSQIDKYAHYMGEGILDNPNACLKEGLAAILELSGARLDRTPRLRITRLPRDARIGIRNIRADRIGKLIAVEGLIKRATEVRPMIIKAAYHCNTCERITFYNQYSMVPTPPLSCDRNQDGCGRGAGQTKLSLVWEECEYANVQKLEIQENPEYLKGGASPEHLTVYCMDDLTGLVNPGDRVVINGILRPADTGGKLKSNIQEIQLDAISIEMEKKDFDQLEVTDEEIQKILEVSKDPGLVSNIVQSIAPTIHGYSIEKESMAMQLFGGVEKNLEDGTKIRGDIHILLVGDPGVAKSQMLRYMSRMAPRGVYASGKSTSAAGLIAAAVKDDFGEGNWTLEAGAMVLADRGHFCVDELDKMAEGDRSALHEAMEAQEVHVSKAGINATLPTRCSMLAACNPQYGRFDEHEALSEQIELPPSLLSRFDLIFAMTDKPEKKRDEQITKHVLRSHKRGEALKAGNKEILDATQSIKPFYDADFIRKYVAYSKKITPILSSEAEELIMGAYLGIRKKGEGDDKTVPITARQLEAFIRLSEASARARLSPIVEKQDAERAIKIVGYFLGKMANQGDIDAIETATPKAKRDKINLVFKTIKDNPEPISRLDLEDRLADKIDKDTLMEILESLHRSARVSESRGKYSPV